MSISKNKLTLALILTSLLFSLSAYADDDLSESGSIKKMERVYMNVKPFNTTASGALKAQLEERKEKLEEMKKMREEGKSSIEENRQEMKENLENYREENEDSLKSVFSSLDEETKAELKAIQDEYAAKAEAIQDEYAAKAEAIHEELKSDDLSVEEKEELIKTLEELRVEQGEKIKEVLSGNEEALQLLEERKDVYEVNRELRRENSETRAEFREAQKETISQYKEAFSVKVGAVLEKANTSALENLLDRIEKIATKYEDNEKMTQETKDKILSQLEALKDIINDKLDASDEEELIDIESLLDIE